MSYEYIKVLEGLQCISCEKEIKNLPIAHELYSPANSSSKFNFVVCPYCGEGMYIQGVKSEEKHVIKQIFRPMVTMDDYNFIRTILQAKRKELSRALEKAKSAKEKEKIQKELDNLRRNISKYELEYSIDSDMSGL